jgi:hypothetical protein
MAIRPALGITRRRLRRGPSVSAGGQVFTPVFLEERGAGERPHGCWLVAAKRPVAVVVADPHGRRLLRLDDGVQAD